MRLWSSGTWCPVAAENRLRGDERKSSGWEFRELRFFGAPQEQSGLLSLCERQQVEVVGKLSGALLDFHVSR